MLKSGWHFLVPIFFLVIALIYPEVLLLTPEKAAVAATAILIVFALIFGYRGKRVSLKQIAMAVIESGRVSLDIILIGAAAGIMVGIMSISGLAFGMTMQLLALSGDNVFLLLLLIAVLAFVLGIGLPTVSVYILTATLLAPALIKLGVTPMAAHMFVMYNGMLSMITPPVAFAAYAAANIARTDGWTTGWIACVVGWSTFILPFLFVLTPSLLMDGPTYLIVWNFVRILFALFVGTAGIVGYALAPLSLVGAAALRLRRAADRAAAGELHRRLHHQLHRHRRRHRAAGVRPSAAEAAQGDRGGVFIRPQAKSPAPSPGASEFQNAALVGWLEAAVLLLAPDAERFLRRPVGDREQHRLVLRVVRVFASTTAPRTRRSDPTPAPCRRPWCVPWPSTQTKIVPSVELVVLALEALRQHARGRRPWSACTVPAGDRIGVAHARAVALVDVAGLHHALDDRPVRA